MKKKIKITAIIVTFNRLELLKKVISGLSSQTRNIDEIIIINNSSTDGTEEWLSKQNNLIVVKQENLGSSGGQWRGVKEAYERGADYIWIMDDDVVADKNCLEVLSKFMGRDKIIAPTRVSPSANHILCDTLKLNMNNPFKNIWTKILEESDFSQELISAEGIAFEGPIIHRSLVEKIGLPEKNFFIFADDTEYCLRALKHNYKIFISRDAKLDRLLELPEDETVFSWKNYYIIRNIIAIDVLHGSFLVRWLRPWAYLISWLGKAKSKEDKATVRRAFKDGYFYKSEN